MGLLEGVWIGKDGLLGLKTLTLLKHTEELVRKRNPQFSLEDISEEDPDTFAMLAKGESACVFQFESAGMQRF